MFLYSVIDHVAKKDFAFNVFENDATAERALLQSDLVKAPHPEDFELACLADVVMEDNRVTDVKPCFHSVVRLSASSGDMQDNRGC